MPVRPCRLGHRTTRPSTDAREKKATEFERQFTLPYETQWEPNDNRYDNNWEMALPALVRAIVSAKTTAAKAGCERHFPPRSGSHLRAAPLFCPCFEPGHMREAQQSLRRLLLGAAIMLAVLAASSLGLELGARLILPHHVSVWQTPIWARGAHFMAVGTLENKPGYPGFRAHSEVRHLAYFPTQNGTYTPEFDCRFRSDEHGFLSNLVRYQESETLVLGDSFTVGVGGCDWISDLSHSTRASTYFAAFPGYGAMHWIKVLNHLEAQHKPQRVLIVFITDDFFRGDWVYPQEQIDCVSLLAACGGTLFYFPAVGDMATIAFERAAAHRQFQTAWIRFKEGTKQHLVATYTLWRMLTQRAHRPANTIEDSIAAVREIASRYPTKLLWVNERGEARRGDGRTAMVARALRGLDVENCGIPDNEFLPRDNHPNAKGYGRLRACVDRIAGEWKETADFRSAASKAGGHNRN